MLLRQSLGTYSLLLAASAALGLMVAWSAPGSQIDLGAYDLFLRLRMPPRQPSSCVILAIDEESLNSFGGVTALRRPLAEALQILARHRPLAVAIDIVLSEPRSEPENQALARAIAHTANVVLAANLRVANTPAEGAWEEPLAPFRRAAAAIGHVHAEPDDDGVCRRVLLAKAANGERRWALALEAYRLAQGGPPILETESGLEVGKRFIPASPGEQRSLRIWYANPETPLARISLKQILDEPERAALVAGRVVFVGVDVLGGIDRYLMTPYSWGRPMSGVEINAHVYETLARGRFLETVPETLTLAVSLAFALALGVCFWTLSGNRAVAAAGLTLAAAHAAPLLFFYSGRVLPFSAPVAVAWICFLSGGAFHYRRVRGKLSLAETERSRYQRAVHYVTHEMRTPLTTIQGSSELISRYPLSEEKRQQVAALIHRESQRLARMVEMFLSVERLSAGQFELRPAKVETDEMLAACVERVLPLAERKQARIRHQKGGVEPIWGDREFLEYACYNLITNAVKYSPAGSDITVRAWHDNNAVHISVEDRGYGMDEGEIKNIFKKFYRTRRAQQSGEAGTGLGLAIVEEIVVQHGGSIAVESRVNQGSRFTLALPRVSTRELQTAAEPPL